MSDPYKFLSQPDNMPSKPKQMDAPGKKDLSDPGREGSDYKSHSNVDDELPLKDSGMCITDKE